eukprot:gene30397-36726_t
MDPYLEFFTKFILPTDYLTVVVFALGHWHKPFFKHHAANVTYYEHMSMMVQDLRVTLEKGRKAVFKSHSHPNLRIIWRLLAHVCNCDEINFSPHLFDHLPRSKIVYRDGKLWSNITLEATWVRKYNEVIRSVADAHCDLLLDAYTLYHKYIEYFSHDRGVRIHSDGMHNCPGGVPRGEMWLLQQMLKRNCSL